MALSRNIVNDLWSSNSPARLCQKRDNNDKYIVRWPLLWAG